jgi:hypothetical protein
MTLRLCTCVLMAAALLETSRAAAMELGTNFWNIGWHKSNDCFADWQKVQGDSPWNPRFLQDIAIYKSLRFMDWDNTNNSTRARWTERNRKENPRQNPVAYEWMIDLCNRMNADMWATVPHLTINHTMADEPSDYGLRLCLLVRTGVDLEQVALTPLLARLSAMTAAELIEAGGVKTCEPLKPELKLYLEYSNETWNGAFKQSHYCCDEGQALGLDKNRWTAGFRFHAWAAIRLFRAADLVFGTDSPRVVKVLATQSSNAWIAGQHQQVMKDVKLNPWGTKANAIATAPYFGHKVSGDAAEAAEQLRAAIRKSAEESARHRKIADDTGLKLIAYEGGQHVLRKAQDINRNPVMFDLYQEYLREMSKYFEHFSHYCHVGRWGDGGAWGAMEFTGQPLAEAHKYRALAELAKNPTAESRTPQTGDRGRNIQRTMTLLATSTPQKRNTVKVLFYGQSITEQAWTKTVAADLRQRFPHADLVIENRAIGGFAAQLLVKTAETDLYPFYPDLVIFHVYGSHIEYENIIRRIRERTTAEVLMQTDHMAAADSLDEETDPAKLSPKQWNPWMNYAFLPGIARKYGTELVDQRNLWKQYLRDEKLAPSALLRDGVHLNERGCQLMARIVSGYLRYDPKLPDAAWRDLVRTYEVGKDLRWTEGKLVLEFEGNRVDAICKDGRASPAMVHIDGHRPSELPGVYSLTRTTSYPGSGWPCILRVEHEQPWQIEDWTLTLTEVPADLKQIRFRVEGSKTGPDGEGTTGVRFLSKSGRVIIEPDDWNFEYAQKVFRRPIPAGFQIRWQVVPHFVDEFVSPGVKDAAVETTVTLAQGFPSGNHRLEITGGPDTPIAALRVYRPPSATR